MSRLPPIPARAAATPEGQSLLRAFERLCDIETDTEAIELDLASLAVGSRITALTLNVDRNRDEAMRVNIRADEVSAAPRPSPPGGSEGGGGGARPRPPNPGNDPPSGAVVANPGNHLSVVQAVAAANPTDFVNSCLAAGGNFNFLDALIAELRKESERWGFLCRATDCSRSREDAIGYFAGLESPPVQQSATHYAFDVIGNHCPTATSGPATPQWADVTGAGGPINDQFNRWKFPR